MFKNSWILLLVCVFFISTQDIYAEKRSKIIFNDGNRISGVIIKHPHPDSLRLKLKGGFRSSYAKKDIKEIISLRKRFRLGVGLGINYSVLGLQFEYEPIDYFSFFVSAGIAAMGEDPYFEVMKTYEIGAIVHFTDAESTFRPRVSLVYGSNSYISEVNEYFGTSSSTLYNGMSIGIGLKFNISDRHGTTLDIFYIDTADAQDKINDLKDEGYRITEDYAPISFSVGYQFSF